MNDETLRHFMRLSFLAECLATAVCLIAMAPMVWAAFRLRGVVFQRTGFHLASVTLLVLTLIGLYMGYAVVHVILYAAFEWHLTHIEQFCHLPSLWTRVAPLPLFAVVGFLSRKPARWTTPAPPNPALQRTRFARR